MRRGPLQYPRHALLGANSLGDAGVRRPTRAVLVYRGAFRENRLAHMPLGRHRPRVCRPSRQQRARAHREHRACVRPRPSHAIGNRVPCGVIVRPKRVPSSARGGGRTLRDRRFTRSGAADRVAVSRFSAAECENECRKPTHAHPLRPFAQRRGGFPGLVQLSPCNQRCRHADRRSCLRAPLDPGIDELRGVSLPQTYSPKATRASRCEIARSVS